MRVWVGVELNIMNIHESLRKGGRSMDSQVIAEALPDRLIRKREYRRILGEVSEATFWRMEKRGDLAARQQISAGIYGYWLSEALAKIK